MAYQVAEVVKRCERSNEINHLGAKPTSYMKKQV